jgi:hypothetical protein
MALYDLKLAQQLVVDGSWDYATERCRNDVRALGLVSGQVERIVRALTGSDFRKEFGPCKTNWGLVQADDYTIQYDDVAMARCGQSQGLDLYIKFAVYTDPSGQSLLLISFHES